MTILFPLSWDMNATQTIAALRGIHFIDDNFDRFVADIQSSVYEVFEKEISRYQAGGAEELKQRRAELKNNVPEDLGKSGSLG